MQIITFGAADLVKKSAMQLCYQRRNKVIPPVTENQLKGVAYQEAQAKSVFQEMKGTYKHDYIYISYCIDEVQFSEKTGKYLCIERKMQDERELPQWFINKSILQTSLYSSLVKFNPNTLYSTAQFRLNEGHPYYELKIVDFKYYLKIGENLLFFVPPKVEVLDFFIKKAKASLNYETGKEWDHLYKHKEFDFIQPLFTNLSNLIQNATSN